MTFVLTTSQLCDFGLAKKLGNRGSLEERGGVEYLLLN